MRFASTFQRITARAASAALFGLIVAGCQSVKDEGAEMFSGGESLEAQMRPTTGSAATGVVKFAPTSSGVAMLVSISGLATGQLYRVAIHANGNCSSPNAFSAGPPWVPPGKTEQLMGDKATGQPVGDGSLTLVVRVSGVYVNGPESIFGKSVVLHYGAQGWLETTPGAPNNRVACGVIGPVVTGF